jgi:spore coat protein U-like protein
MGRFPGWFQFCVAATVFLGSPAWGADAVCRFRAGGLSLNFGTLDPSSNAAVGKPVVVATTFADMAGDCSNGTMTISIQGSASRQLVNGSNTINYTITGLPITLPKPGNAPPGNPGGGYVTWFAPNQLQGVIEWIDYADVPAGTYTDSVTILVNP